MALPDRATAIGWTGRDVVAADDSVVGVCHSVYADDATGTPEWMAVDIGSGRLAIVPLRGATQDGDRVRTPCARDDVLSAPDLGSAERVSREQEHRLYDHYGIRYSLDESPSGLPAGEPAAAASPAPATAPAATAPAATAPAAAAPAAASGTAASAPSPADGRTVGAHRRSSDVAARLRTAAGSESGRRALAVGGAATVAAAAGWSSRSLWWGGRSPLSRALTRTAYALHLRPRPPSRGDLVAVYARRAAEGAAPVVAAGGRLAERARREGAPLLRQGGSAALQGGLTTAALGVMAAQRGSTEARRAVAVAAPAAERAGERVRRTAAVATGAATGGGASASGLATGAASRLGRAGRDAVAGVTTPVVSTTKDLTDAVSDTWRSTMRKISLALGLGVGYVLGTRDGRERYEQIRAKAQELMDRPDVQRAIGQAKGKISGEEFRSSETETSTSTGTGSASFAAGDGSLGSESALDLTQGADVTRPIDRP